MRIECVTIPHEKQRYPTTGDWLFGEVWHRTNDDHPERKARTLASSVIESLLSVRVSKMPDERYEAAVMVHEFLEALLCNYAGIAEKDVSRFDQLYEKARTECVGKHPLTGGAAGLSLADAFGCYCVITAESEPGDDIHAPYYKQHQLATSVERMFLAEVGASWNDYEKANLDLYANEK